MLLEKTMSYKKPAPFRIWLQNQWADHQEEILNWTGRPCDYAPQDYFQKYKWWLKTVYKKGKPDV